MDKKAKAELADRAQVAAVMRFTNGHQATVAENVQVGLARAKEYITEHGESPDDFKVEIEEIEAYLRQM
jgi:hypothetical protein